MLADPPTPWLENELAFRLHGSLEIDPRALAWLDEWDVHDPMERERAVKRAGLIRSSIAKHYRQVRKSRKGSDG